MPARSIKKDIPAQGPREALLVAAWQLFPERGLGSVSVRELARKAGVNIAAVHYYYGGKEQLYLEMLRQHFSSTREIRREIQARFSSEQIELNPTEVLQRWIEGFVSSMFEERDIAVQRLFERELAAPTRGLDMIFKEVIAPAHAVLIDILERLRPDLKGTGQSELCAISIVGQCLYYRFASPIALKLLRAKKIDPDLITRISGHISQFSLAALASITCAAADP